jgi:DNA-binding transcriptional LysR family regulator
MNETNVDWDDLRLFLAIARLGGLSPAAQTTGKSPPTLSRRMVALEKATGKELFHRLPRGYVLTTKGEAFLHRVVEIEAQLLPLTANSSHQRRTLIKISAGGWMTQALCQKADRIARNDTTLRFISADQTLDIARREAVIGIRNRRPEQLGLASRRVGEVQFRGYAAIGDTLPWVQVLSPTPSAQWVAAQGDDGALQVTTARNALDLARAGVARAVLPTFVGDAEDGLIPVTDTIPELAHDQWLVTHNEERFDPPVRRTIDRIHTILRDLHRANAG